MKRRNHQIKPVRVLLLCAAVAATLAALPARAADATWFGGTGNWNLAGNWSPVGVPNSALTNVFIDGGNAINSIVTLNIGATIGNLTIDAGDSLIMANGQSLGMGGVLSNTGSFALAGSNFQTNLFFNGDTGLSGSGSFTLSNSGNNRI